MGSVPFRMFPDSPLPSPTVSTLIIAPLLVIVPSLIMKASLVMADPAAIVKCAPGFMVSRSADSILRLELLSKVMFPLK